MSRLSGDAIVRKTHFSQGDGINDAVELPADERSAFTQEISSDERPSPEGPRPTPGLGSRMPSAMSLPSSEMPERRSSASVLGYNAITRESSIQDFPSWRLPPGSAVGQVIPSRGRAHSPVRKALDQDAVSTENLRRSPSKTFIRIAPPPGILDTTSSQHGRIEMSVRLPAPLFVGGGTIEGHISLIVDNGVQPKPRAKPILISKLSIDVIGVEEVSDGRRWIFLSLATDVFDIKHPPPMSLVTSQAPVSHSELFWALKPSHVSLPFRVNLPLNIGPPPYVCRKAGIRYFLCPVVIVESEGEQSVIRQRCNIQMLTVHDPEKALSSLPSPLLASDSILIPSGDQVHRVKLTAGLHRQIWMNGAMIFVDIHIANNTAKTIKKIEIQLEKKTLWYSHSAAGSDGKIANHLRLAKRTDCEVVSTSITKKSKYWKGISPKSSDVRTCGIDIPRGLVSISSGRYFEVRYFLNVVVTVTTFRTVTVQLPVTIIHINSLDILPNSVAQVAASIEAKRARTVPVCNCGPLHAPFQQGLAFSAPRRQALDRMEYEQGALHDDELSALTRDLDDSPRRYGRGNDEGPSHKAALSAVNSCENVPPSRPSDLSSSHHHYMRHPSCYHCHLTYDHYGRSHESMAPINGPKLLRLQLSTSGLGFSDSDFEVPANSPPRKVMLSENERQMILQQRDKKVQRHGSLKSRPKPGGNRSSTEHARRTSHRPRQEGWKNVAVISHASGAGLKSDGRTRPALQRVQSDQIGRATKRRPGTMRARSKTNPEQLGTAQ